MNLHNNSDSQKQLLREYFLNAYLIAVTLELGKEMDSLAEVEHEELEMVLSSGG